MRLSKIMENARVTFGHVHSKKLQNFLYSEQNMKIKVHARIFHWAVILQLSHYVKNLSEKLAYD